MDKCPYEVCKLQCETRYKEVPRVLTRQVCTGRAGEWRGASPCVDKKCGRCEPCHKRGHYIEASEPEIMEDEVITEETVVSKKHTRAEKNAAAKEARLARKNAVKESAAL